jgi:hypothetical protein
MATSADLILPAQHTNASGAAPITVPSFDVLLEPEVPMLPRAAAPADAHPHVQLPADYVPWNLVWSKVRPWSLELVRLFRDLVRVETELWNRVEVAVQQAHGVPLAWLEIMQVVAATEGCAVCWTSRGHCQSRSVGRARSWTKSRLQVCTGGTLADRWSIEPDPAD